MNLVNQALQFARDVWRELTWRKLLFAGLAALASELLRVIGRPVIPDVQPAMYIAGLVISLTVMLGILMAVLVADQAIARGTRPWPTYLIALIVASACAGFGQAEIRHAFELHTLVDRPGVSVVARETQKVVVAVNSLLYGLIFLMLYQDHRRRRGAEEQVRATELVRTEGQQQLIASRLAAIRAEVDPAALLDELRSLRRMYESGANEADATLDDLIMRLRAKLAPVDATARRGNTQ